MSESGVSDHSRKSLGRIFSGQHIDDVSIYHGDDELRGHRNSIDSEEMVVSGSSLSSASGSKDPEKGALEATPSSKLERDPNLVSNPTNTPA